MRETIQLIDFLFLILVVLYLMCQYVEIHSAVYRYTYHFKEHSAFVFGLYSIFQQELLGGLESNGEIECDSERSGQAVLCFLFFRSIVECMRDDCLSIKLDNVDIFAVSL